MPSRQGGWPGLLAKPAAEYCQSTRLAIPEHPGTGTEAPAIPGPVWTATRSSPRPDTSDSPDLLLPHFGGVPLVVGQDEPFDPLNIGRNRPGTVITPAHDPFLLAQAVWAWHDIQNFPRPCYLEY